MPLEESRNLRLPVDLSNDLNRLAEVKGMNASQVMRLALRQYVEREIELSNERRASAVELSNVVQGDRRISGASDAQLAEAWGRIYG